MEKMTYVKALKIAIATVDNEEVKTKLTALQTSIAKKNSAERKPTATQKANAGFKIAIENGMELGKKYTITDLMKNISELADLSNQKVSAIVRQMVENGTVVREEIKRKAYFSLAKKSSDCEVGDGV